jgi:hypothetical protein
MFVGATEPADALALKLSMVGATQTRPPATAPRLMKSRRDSPANCRTSAIDIPPGS